MDKSAQQPRQSSPKAKSDKLIVIIISSILIVALVAVGVLYVMQVSKLNDAKAQIVDLEGNVASIEGNVASLQAQLTAEKANITSLQTQ
jgi:flagellar basal body-associated protein FliL